MTDAAFAIFQNRDTSRVAIRALSNLGFGEKEIQCYQAKKNDTKDFYRVQGYQVLAGLRVGAAVGVIAGLVVFALIATGIVPFIIHMNPSWLEILFTAIATVLLFGVVGAGGGAMVGVGTPDRAAKRYGQYLTAGGVLLSVHSDNSEGIHRARDILMASGGQDVQLLDQSETWRTAQLERINLQDLQNDRLKVNY